MLVEPPVLSDDFTARFHWFGVFRAVLTRLVLDLSVLPLYFGV